MTSYLIFDMFPCYHLIFLIKCIDFYMYILAVQILDVLVNFLPFQIENTYWNSPPFLQRFHALIFFKAVCLCSVCISRVLKFFWVTEPLRVNHWTSNVWRIRQFAYRERANVLFYLHQTWNRISKESWI